MKVSRENIQSYIPQRPPFIMVDNLLEASPENFTTDFHVDENNIFVEEGQLSHYAILENIAQSTIAGFAFTRFFSGPKIEKMYIGSISNLYLYGLPGINDRVLTHISLLKQYGNLFLVKGESYCKNNKLLECEMRLVGA